MLASKHLGSEVRTSGLYLRCYGFKPQPRDRLFLLKTSLVILSPSMQMSAQYHKLLHKQFSLNIRPIHYFTSFPIIRRCIIPGVESVVSKHKLTCNATSDRHENYTFTAMKFNCLVCVTEIQREEVSLLGCNSAGSDICIQTFRRNLLRHFS